MVYTYIDFIFGVSVAVIAGLVISLILFCLNKLLKWITKVREVSEEVINNRKVIEMFKKELIKNKEKVTQLEKEIKVWKKS